MAAPDQTASRLGQVNKAGGDDALFLKVFSGLVLSRFKEKSVTEGRVVEREISNGKSATFPAIGATTSGLHTPGTYIVGDAIGHNEATIEIDGLLLAKTFVAKIDELENYFDVRSEYANEMGQSLAFGQDKLRLQIMLNGAAVTTPNVTAVAGETNKIGYQLNSTNSDTVAADLKTAMFDVAQNFDEKDVPDEDRFIYMKPAQYYMLVENQSFMNRDFGGSGSENTGDLAQFGAGMRIVKCNHVPTGNLASEIATKYNGDFRNTVAVASHRSGAGTLRLLGLQTESEYLITNQGHLMVAKLATGHDILRPESCAQIRTATPV